MIVYCNSEEHTIEIEDGEIITVEQCKQYAAEGKIEDCNIALQRLESFGWDWQKLDQFYADCDKART